MANPEETASRIQLTAPSPYTEFEFLVYRMRECEKQKAELKNALIEKTLRRAKREQQPIPDFLYQLLLDF